VGHRSQDGLTYYLLGLGGLSEENGLPTGEESEVVKERKHLAAGLVNGRNHSPPILG